MSGVARDVAWVGSQGFAVAWEERAADTARLNTRATAGTFPGQIQLMTADGNANYGLQLAVDQGRAEPRISVWTTNDPDHELTVIRRLPVSKWVCTLLASERAVASSLSDVFSNKHESSNPEVYWARNSRHLHLFRQQQKFGRI